MIRSKDIQDYVERPLSEVKAGAPLPCDLHLYFNRNKHVLVWFKAGSVIPAETLGQYAARGGARVWVHRDDVKLLEAPAQPPPIPPQKPVPIDHGKKIGELLKNGDLQAKKKGAMVAQQARDALKEALDDIKSGREAVKDVLEHLREDTRQMAQEIWNLSDQAPEIEHGINVATYTVLLALAFGKIDPSLIGDLALAGILHDIGVSQIPVEIAARPWKSLDSGQAEVYQGHVEAGLRVIQALAPDTPERVRFLIQQHQEKFDGTGYPRKLQGFNIDGVGQLLAIAEMLETFKNGQWDGEERTYHAALDALERLEKARTFPEFFNPEILAAVLRWTRSAEADAKPALARKTVEGQASDVMKSAS